MFGAGTWVSGRAIHEWGTPGRRGFEWRIRILLWAF